MTGEPPDQEPQAPTAQAIVPAPKGRQSLARVRRELSEDELASPAVQRLLVEDLERLQHEAVDLGEYRERYHVADKRAAVMEEKLKLSVAGEVVFGVCLSAGAAILGYAPLLWEKQPNGWIAVTLGGLLMVGGVVSRVVRR